MKKLPEHLEVFEGDLHDTRKSGWNPIRLNSRLFLHADEQSAKGQSHTAGRLFLLAGGLYAFPDHAGRVCPVLCLCSKGMAAGGMGLSAQGLYRLARCGLRSELGGREPVL